MPVKIIRIGLAMVIFYLLNYYHGILLQLLGLYVLIMKKINTYTYYYKIFFDLCLLIMSKNTLSTFLGFYSKYIPYSINNNIKISLLIYSLYNLKIYKDIDIFMYTIVKFLDYIYNILFIVFFNRPYYTLIYNIIIYYYALAHNILYLYIIFISLQFVCCLNYYNDNYLDKEKYPNIYLFIKAMCLFSLFLFITIIVIYLNYIVYIEGKKFFNIDNYKYNPQKSNNNSGSNGPENNEDDNFPIPFSERKRKQQDEENNEVWDNDDMENLIKERDKRRKEVLDASMKRFREKKQRLIQLEKAKAEAEEEAKAEAEAEAIKHKKYEELKRKFHLN